MLANFAFEEALHLNNLNARPATKKAVAEKIGPFSLVIDEAMSGKDNGKTCNEESWRPVDYARDLRQIDLSVFDGVLAELFFLFVSFLIGMLSGPAQARQTRGSWWIEGTS